MTKLFPVFAKGTMQLIKFHVMSHFCKVAGVLDKLSDEHLRYSTRKQSKLGEVQ